MPKTDNNFFHQACIDACVKMGKEKRLGTYAYNILNENGIVDHILNGSLDLDEYSDNDLKTFHGLGCVSIEIIRAAWNFFKKQPVQERLDLNDVTVLGYSTGKDLIDWIKNHNLEDKQVYYAGHNCIGFIVSFNEFEGMEYHTTADLNVIDGNYVEFRDYIS